MSKTYRIDIAGTESGAIAEAYGDLDVVLYIARKAKTTMLEAAAGAEFAVTVQEVDRIGGNVLATLVSFTGDAEVAGYVLAKKLRALAKAEAAE